MSAPRPIFQRFLLFLFCCCLTFRLTSIACCRINLKIDSRKEKAKSVYDFCLLYRTWYHPCAENVEKVESLQLVDNVAMSWRLLKYSWRAFVPPWRTNSFLNRAPEKWFDGIIMRSFSMTRRNKRWKRFFLEKLMKSMRANQMNEREKALNKSFQDK